MNIKRIGIDLAKQAFQLAGRQSESPSTATHLPQRPKPSPPHGAKPHGIYRISILR